MGGIEKLFDTYSLNARVKPVLFLVFPIVITIFVWLEESRTWGGAIVTFIVSFGVISFAANQMSTRGNILQEKLFLKWGGEPTTIIMRHSDSRLDKYTKERYMQKLEILIPNFVPVTNEQEMNNPSDADDMYRTATNFLREKTRDIKKYPLVFKENISYGFSRNTASVKVLGVLSTISALVASSYLVWYNHIKGVEKGLDEVIFSIPFINSGLLVLLSVILFIWIFAVTNKWTEIRAFAYAKALFASCEKEI